MRFQTNKVFIWWFVLILVNWNALAQSPTKISEIVLGGSGGDYMERSSCVIPATGGGYIVGAASGSPISGTKSQNEYGGGDFWVDGEAGERHGCT